MSEIMNKIRNWPRDLRTRPIFKNSKAAVFYGTLISNHPMWIDQLKDIRQEAYEEIQLEKRRRAPNFNRMVQLAVQAQFCREAYEEAERMKEGGEKSE